MTFEPAMTPPVLIGIGVLLMAIRMVALYRVLVRTGSGRYRVVVARWCGLTAAVLLLVVAAARPGLEPGTANSAKPTRTAPLTSSNLNVFFVVDRSVDSRVEDYGDRKSRMSGIRSDIDSLIDQYPRARFSIISFAGKARVDWALSDDVWGLKPLVAGMSPYTLVQSSAMYDVDAGAAHELLNEKLQRAKQRYPRSENVVFYLGEGASGSRVAQQEFAIGAGKIVGGATLGYGTPAGSAIPQGWVNGRLVYMSDPTTGEPLNNAIDESRLRSVADQLGVPYFHRESGQSIAAVIPAVQGNVAPEEDAALRASRVVERNELYWVFSLLAAALVLVEIYLSIRDFRRVRMVRQDSAR